jgi:Ketopantoate reductase PanE/ApbA C terminal
VPLPAGYADERLAFTDQVPASMTSSMHHDLERGNRLEGAWLSGDVVERGARLGVATLCNRAIFDITARGAQNEPTRREGSGATLSQRYCYRTPEARRSTAAATVISTATTSM